MVPVGARLSASKSYVPPYLPVSQSGLRAPGYPELLGYVFEVASGLPHCSYLHHAVCVHFDERRPTIPPPRRPGPALRTSGVVGMFPGPLPPVSDQVTRACSTRPRTRCRIESDATSGSRTAGFGNHPVGIVRHLHRQSVCRTGDHSIRGWSRIRSSRCQSTPARVLRPACWCACSAALQEFFFLAPRDRLHSTSTHRGTRAQFSPSTSSRLRSPPDCVARIAPVRPARPCVEACWMRPSRPSGDLERRATTARIPTLPARRDLHRPRAHVVVNPVVRRQESMPSADQVRFALPPSLCRTVRLDVATPCLCIGDRCAAGHRPGAAPPALSLMPFAPATLRREEQPASSPDVAEDRRRRADRARQTLPPRSSHRRAADATATGRRLALAPPPARAGVSEKSRGRSRNPPCRDWNLVLVQHLDRESARRRRTAATARATAFNRARQGVTRESSLGALCVGNHGAACPHLEGGAPSRHPATGPTNHALSRNIPPRGRPRHLAPATAPTARAGQHARAPRAPRPPTAPVASWRTTVGGGALAVLLRWPPSSRSIPRPPPGSHGRAAPRGHRLDAMVCVRAALACHAASARASSMVSGRVIWRVLRDDDRSRSVRAQGRAYSSCTRGGGGERVERRGLGRLGREQRERLRRLRRALARAHRVGASLDREADEVGVPAVGLGGGHRVTASRARPARATQPGR